MCLSMACQAQCNQILLHVATCLTSESEVVYLQLLHAAAVLTAPAVAFQYSPVELTVLFRAKP